MADSNAALRDRLLERPVTPLNIPTTTADIKLTTKAILLVGWSLRETTASATATAEFEGSMDTAGPHVGEQQIASGGTGSFQICLEGVLCESGLLLHVISGSVAGCAYVRGPA